MTHYVTVEDIVAVHANAHYTYIFTGSAKLFCPLAIGDGGVAARHRPLHPRAPQPHRQHRRAWSGIRRAGDNELIELAAPTTTRCRSAAAGSAR